MVWPDMDVTTSSGRMAFPSGMFSTRPITPTAFTFALRAASARIVPVTAAAPPMSPFMLIMLAPGFSDRPPESKHTPLPTNAIGASSFLRAPFQRMTTSWLSRSLPCPTPRSEPMPSFFISASPSTSTFRPSLESCLARVAKAAGYKTFGGSLMRSRARNTLSATASIAVHIFFAAAVSRVPIVTDLMVDSYSSRALVR